MPKETATRFAILCLTLPVLYQLITPAGVGLCCALLLSVSARLSRCLFVFLLRNVAPEWRCMVNYIAHGMHAITVRDCQFACCCGRLTPFSMCSHQL